MAALRRARGRRGIGFAFTTNDAAAAASPLVFGGLCVGLGYYLMRTGPAVQLVSAAHDATTRGAFDRASEDEIEVDLRDDLLGELACLEAGEAFTRDRRARVRSEIDALPGLRTWLDRVAPRSLTRLARPDAP